LTMIIIATALLALYSLWLYSIGIFGQNRLTEFDLKREKTIYLTISCFLMPICWLITIINPAKMLNLLPEPILLRIITLIISLGFIITGLYMTYFVSKTLKTLELKSDPKFKDFILLMLGLIIWPIGIWFIQPKINKIFS
jgi:hypothetical protein